MTNEHRAFVEIDGLTKAYGNGGSEIKILDGLELNMAAGEILIITGESGSGKTTLLNILGGLDSADSGFLRVANTEVSSIRESQLFEYRQRNLGFIFQFHHLLRDFSAVENSALPAMIAGEDPQVARDKAAALLNRLGLDDRMNHYPYQLSGGERQRVAIARALINDPDLILADEPTGSLDEQRSREIEALLFELVREQGRTMIIVTHDSRLASMGDRHLVLSAGRLQ